MTYAEVMNLAGVERAFDGSHQTTVDDASHSTLQQILEHHIISTKSEDIYAVIADFGEQSVVVALEDTCPVRGKS